MSATTPMPSTVNPVPEADYQNWLIRLRRLHQQFPDGVLDEIWQPTHEQIAERAREISIRKGHCHDPRDQDWRDAEAELQREGAGITWRQHLAEIETSLHRREVTVVFGGNQKAGKSTLVNGAMRRTILAVNDLPETGTLCRISAGEKDEAVVVRDRAGTRREHIPCTSDALRDVTALQPGTVRKRGDQLAERVELTLQGVSIPPGVYWIDSPGLDDTEDMTARAREAADLADVYIFVSSSRQFLSDGEQAYLTAHIAHHGPASVVLVINAWLEKLTAEAWARFNSHNLPHHRNRLMERASEMGFTADAPLVAYPVVGRALVEGDGQGFGGTEFMDMLLAIRSPEHPRIRRTRLFRAAERLRQLADKTQERKQVLQEKIEQEERAIQNAAQMAARRRERFCRQAEDLVRETVASVARQIRQAGLSVRESVTDEWSTLTEGATYRYGYFLTEKANAAIKDAMNTLLWRLGSIVSENEQNCLSDEACQQVWTLLDCPRFQVTGGSDISQVGAGAELAGAAAGGAATWWLGFATFGIATAVASGLGAMAGAISRANLQAEAAAQAKYAIRSSIDAQVSAAADRITGNEEAILRLVLRQCLRSPVTADPDPKPRIAIRQLDMLDHELAALAQTAWQLAGVHENTSGVG
jgi:predicted GTPase